MIIDTHATKFLARGVWITGIRGEKVAMKISQLDRIDQKILMEGPAILHWGGAGQHRPGQNQLHQGGPFFGVDRQNPGAHPAAREADYRLVVFQMPKGALIGLHQAPDPLNR